MKKELLFTIIILLFAGLGIQNASAQDQTADNYFMILNTNTNTNQLSGVTGVASIDATGTTSIYGDFSISGGNLRYKTKLLTDRAGVDFCVVNLSGGGTKKIAVVVWALRPAVIDFQTEDGGNYGEDHIFNLNNVLVPMENFPDNWLASYRFKYSGSDIPEGISLTVHYTENMYITPRLYVDSNLKFEDSQELQVRLYDTGSGTVAGVTIPVGPLDRHYAIVDKRENRGTNTNKRAVYTASGGRVIKLIPNYSNSEKYGAFTLEGNVLYYTSDTQKPGYGMDKQAFTVTLSGSTTTKLGYGITVEPIDKAVAKGGWAILETKDIIKGLPRNYSIRYTYWNDAAGTSQITNIPSSDLTEAVFNIPLNGPVLTPGDPGHPGGEGNYASQTYWVKTELYQNLGTDTKIRRIASESLPLFCYENKLPDWLSKGNYDSGLISFEFESPTFSVCPEKSVSTLGTSYEVSVDLEVRTMAYKMKDDNGTMVRDYDIPGFNVTSYSKYTGYYESSGTEMLPSSEGDNTPFHRYKVASEKSNGAGFPNKNTTIGNYNKSDYSYGTRKSANAMALYIETEIAPTNLWGDIASGMDNIIIEPEKGEIIIEKGICGVLQDELEDRTTSLVYRQDFGGNDPGDDLFYNPDNIWLPRNSVNVLKALEGSTYSYRTFLRENSSSTQYPNHGLPFLEEGEFFITKETEQHYNPNARSSPMWTRFHSDHTNLNDVNRGYMMQVNAGVEKGTFFDYNISDLCKGATMTFTAWIKNTVDWGTPGTPADQIFEIYDSETGKLLSRYYTGPILNRGNSSSQDNINAWKQYGFEFTLPVEADNVRLKIINNGRGSDGNDFAVDDIEIRIITETSITMGDQPDQQGCEEVDVEVSATIANNDSKKFYTWLYSPDGEVNEEPWLTLAAGEVPENSDGNFTFNPYSSNVNRTLYPDYPTGYYRFAIGYSIDFLNGNCYVVADPKLYTLNSIGDVFLWTGAYGAQNDNIAWSEPGNWLRFYPEENRTEEATTYPNECNDVYIPGKGVTHYPMITSGDACRNIYFFQGGQIKNPQNLEYTRAFVEYNFGQVDGTSQNVSENKTPIQQDHSSPSLNRGQWYTIASPLKKTVTGDFGFAGRPHTWQMKFEALKDANDNISYGQWSDTFNEADIELAVNHNAMALFIGQYIPDYIGLDDHKNIELIDGAIRIPFFYDIQNTQYTSHKLHEYNLIEENSYFYRYYMPTLEPIYENPMIFKRKETEANRFIFENENNIPETPYTYILPAGKDVLIGNPFTSQLDMEAFLADNEGVLASPVYYDFVGSYESEDDQTFNYYVKEGNSISYPDLGLASRYVAPLKSFVVTTKEGNDDVTITLNYAQTVVAQEITPEPSPSPEPVLRNADSGKQSLSDILLLSVESKSGSSALTLSFEEKDAGNAGLLRMKKSKVPSIYAIDPETGRSNMVQFEGGYLRKIIPLGVLAFDSKEQLTIKAFNTENLDVKALYLVDTELGNEVDLLQNNSYTFSNENGMNDRFELHITHKTETNIPDHLLSQIKIKTTDSSVQIVAPDSDMIKSTEIFDMLGRIIIRDTEVNKNSTTYQIPEGDKIIVVKVITEDGSKIQKVILD